MQDSRLLLRVAVKIMLLLSLLFFAWIFIAGFLPDDPADEMVIVDVSHIAVGDAAYFQPGGRKIMVVHKNNDEQQGMDRRYLIVYAQDSFYGCDVKLDRVSMILKAICADIQYDLDGRLIKGTTHHEDLRVPGHQWLDEQQLQLVVD